jgi:type IV pilus assembly protein PilB
MTRVYNLDSSYNEIMLTDTIKQGTSEAGRTNLLFGDWLIERGTITPEQLRAALAEQKSSGERLGRVLVQLKYISETQLTEALSASLAVEHITLDDLSVIDKEIARQVPENIAKRFGLVVVGRQDEKALVAMTDPLNVVAIDTVSVKLKRSVCAAVASESAIRRAIEFVYQGSDLAVQKLRDLVQTENDLETVEDASLEETLETNLEDSIGADDAPVLRFVDLMLSHAAKSRASDIHIEPQEKDMLIRMRVDGILTEMVPPPRKMQPAVLARIKILSRMDIAERRLPQDGRFKIRRGDGEDIDVRVSSLPTIYGEKIVMRILDKTAVNHDLNSLGLEPEMLERFKRTLQLPHGIIIVTGPTGSGKSTTLYSALNALKDPRKNITTVEDPVEYRQRGINQTQVKSEIGLTFASCLRSILRQDPDIILIGEIRDKETMEIAIKASLTGHLVLSTFHTNDAPSAISRFVYMGLEPYLLASTLNLVVAQRLVRRVCEKCREPLSLTDEMVQRLHLTPDQLAHATLFAGKGCQHCSNTGYRGRLPIFEFLPMDTEVRDAIAAGAREAQLRSAARAKGFGDLFSCGVNRMLKGLTTPEEVLRVTFSEDSGT